jgi:hypothetical protein
MKNRLTRSSRSQRGYTNSFVLMYSFDSQIYLLLCSHTQEALAVSRTLRAGFGISGVLAQYLASAWTFYPFDCEHEENLYQAVRQG